MKNHKKILIGLVALLLLSNSVFGIPILSFDNGNFTVGPKTVYANSHGVCNPNTDPNCPGPPSPTDEADQPCEVQSFTALEWIMCPIFKIGADLADSLLKTFQEQLCFRTELNKTTNPDYTCAVTDISAVKPVWSAMKNIASGLLVVIMLIMIIAQATGRGPFA